MPHLRVPTNSCLLPVSHIRNSPRYRMQTRRGTPSHNRAPSPDSSAELPMDSKCNLRRRGRRLGRMPRSSMAQRSHRTRATGSGSAAKMTAPRYRYSASSSCAKSFGCAAGARHTARISHARTTGVSSRSARYPRPVLRTACPAILSPCTGRCGAVEIRRIRFAAFATQHEEADEDNTVSNGSQDRSLG